MKLIEDLKKLFPRFYIHINTFFDPEYKWDGHGDDPLLEDKFPHAVKVTIETIEDGEKKCASILNSGFYLELNSDPLEDEWVRACIYGMLSEAAWDLYSAEEVEDAAAIHSTLERNVGVYS